MPSILHMWHGWFVAVFVFCAAIVFSNGIHWLLFHILRRQQEKQAGVTRFGLGIQRHLGKPARAIFIITCLFVAQPWLPVAQHIHDNIRQILAILLVLALGWFCCGMVYVLENLFLRRFDLTAADNVQARRVHTQFQLFRRVVISFLMIITIGAALWTFHDDRLWKAGTGLLASAGLASLVLATAAKSTAANFLAGMQIALTEPIRIDDVVIVQGEWGRIEEINSAYVVIKIWDLRRLIVPLSYFIENSFQNWTRESADMMGTAFLYVDYTVPVEPLREHLQTVAAGSKLWDGKVCGLQVTDVKEHTMELRCLVSSRNAGDNFDLRCLVREQMIAYIRDNHPHALPTLRMRNVSEQGDAAATAGSPMLKAS